MHRTFSIVKNVRRFIFYAGTGVFVFELEDPKHFPPLLSEILELHEQALKPDGVPFRLPAISKKHIDD